jgi:hypothetical protein
MALSATDNMAKSRLGFFLRSIDYPEEAPAGASSFTLQVDGGEIIAVQAGSALRLMCRLTDDAAQMPRLAEYASGRMLREDAVLACDSEGAFLWREMPASADAHAMRRGFEAFADSCDWWRERLAESAEGEAASPFPEMMIRP